MQLENAKSTLIDIFKGKLNGGEIDKKTRLFTTDDWDALCERSLDDWDALCERSLKNGPFPLFYNKITSLRLDKIPESFLTKIKGIYLHNLKRNLIFEKELLNILNFLSENSIPAIPLKGPALARYLYGDLALRQASCDLDILLKPKDIEKAEKILKKLDFSFSQSDYRRDFLSPPDLTRRIKQISLVKGNPDSGNIILDLHCFIRGFYRQNETDELWQSASYIGSNKQNILMLSGQDLLLYLCLISITSHEFVQLKYTCDIHRLINISKRKIAWQTLKDNVRYSSLNLCLYFPLRIAKSLFSTEIPEEFLSAIKPGRLKERLFTFYLNERNFLNAEKKLNDHFILIWLLRRYFYSKNLGDFFRKGCKKMLASALCQNT